MKPFSMMHLILIVFLCTISNITSAFEFQKDKSETKTILDQLSIYSMDLEIQKKWNAYLNEHANHGQADYHFAISNLYNDYYEAIGDYGRCCEKLALKKNSYSSKWTVAFQKKFDKPYLQANAEFIERFLSALYITVDINYCKESEKEVLFTELHAVDLLQRYIHCFLDFYHTLDSNDQSRISKRKQLAESSLELSDNHSFRQMLSNGRSRLTLIAAEQEYKNRLDPLIIEFFSRQQAFMGPFDIIKTLNDLNMILGSGQCKKSGL